MAGECRVGEVDMLTYVCTNTQILPRKCSARVPPPIYGRPFLCSEAQHTHTRHWNSPQRTAHTGFFAATRTMAAPLTIITTYYNFNANKWMEHNTRHCARQWRRAGAHVILVEFRHGAAADQDTTADNLSEDSVRSYAFHPDVDQGSDQERHVCNVLLQHTVSDIMWYKEIGVNLALKHLPQGCSLVGIFDNDILFVPPADLANRTADSTSPDTDSTEDTWWTDQIRRTFAENPTLSLLQPFQQVALTTEGVRDAILGAPQATTQTATQKGAADRGCAGGEAGDTSSSAPETDQPVAARLLPLDDALDRCEQMMRVRPGVLRSRGDGVVGSAWVVRRHVLSQVPLFRDTVVGGGDALLLNTWFGASSSAPRGLPVCGGSDLQQYYFHPTSTYARALGRHCKRLRHNLQLPLRCAFLPITLMHLYHGELASKRTHDERHQLLKLRRFQLGRDLVAHPDVSGLVRWSDRFRATGINADMIATFERSHTVREKALLRMAKVRRCMDTLKAQVADVVHSEKAMATQEGSAHAELSQMMRQCLQAFPQ